MFGIAIAFVTHDGAPVLRKRVAPLSRGSSGVEDQTIGEWWVSEDETAALGQRPAVGVES